MSNLMKQLNLNIPSSSSSASSSPLPSPTVLPMITISPTSWLSSSPASSPTPLSTPLPPAPVPVSLSSGPASRLESLPTTSTVVSTKEPNISDSLGEAKGSARAQYGFYEINNIVGVQKIKFEGRVRKVAEVEWCKSILDLEDIEMYDQSKIPYGISAEAKNLIMAMDPNAIIYQRTTKTFFCRWCERVITGFSATIRHEKDCAAPGGPGHICSEDCKKKCPGRGDYEPRRKRVKGRRDQEKREMRKKRNREEI